MNLHDALVERFRGLLAERKVTPNGFSYIAGVPQATIKSILNGESANPNIATIKKICDGFELSLAEFFDAECFRNLEQEIK